MDRELMDVSLDSRVVASQDQVSAAVAGETVVLGLENSTYYGLDDVGTRVWELLKVPRAVRQIRDAITSEYDVDVETCERDLLAFLTDLESKGLVDVQSGHAPER